MLHCFKPWLFLLSSHSIGASLSEPHIDEKYVRESYIYMVRLHVTLAPPYTKSTGRMKYLAMLSPRQEKSIADQRGCM